MAAVGSKILTL